MRRVLRFVYKTMMLPIVRKVNVQKSSNIPKYELNEEHVKNAKLVATRTELLKLLPVNGIVAELGVDVGHFSNIILTENNPKKLHLIDYWGSTRYNQDKRMEVENSFKENIENKKVEINYGLSTEVVKGFADNYFDWIYIDTDHSYKTSIRELELYRKKIKKGGIIAGHDFILGNWNGVVRYGVIEAVHEFCVKYNWEILYLTCELKGNPSFAIREIGSVSSN